ncbi:ornithine cyclodeaminase family protein [Massilia sp. erpn]|uniref:ornithine cyclodeaminase family protein n=1 Tax=Massilia sp. erpn TaxID=2738142 RepID=UPI002106104F|nr:hypothetical protein [Massilia sp. erpn]UTY56164.1 ornithine cyclodeaminase family protein [Massilia sp. erpn]
MHAELKRAEALACLDYATLAAAGDIAGLAHTMRAAYAAGLDGVTVPLRSSIQREEPFFAFDTMPAHSERHGLFVAKLGAVIPQSDPALKSVHALVAAFCARSGRPLAILDGDAVTHLKCAAVAAFVTDMCAQPDASVLGLIGSGTQALVQLRAVAAVRPLRRVKVYSRNPHRVAAFVRKHQPQFPQIELQACASAQEAAHDADIVSTATTASLPLLGSADLRRPGLHINCFGNHTPQSREIPAEVLARGSIVIVEDMQTALEEAGPLHHGAYTLERLAAQDPAGLQPQRTVFSSTGHAFLDLLAVAHLIEKLGLDHSNIPSYGVEQQ